MRVVAIVQARMGSSRLPGKVMRLLEGMPMIEVLLKRLSLAKTLDQIIVATSEEQNNIKLVDHIQSIGFDCVQGSEDDVLGRYLLAADVSKADVIVRITGDCPLVDPALVDDAVECFKTLNIDYYSNVMPPTFPDGLDIEVFSRDALQRSSEMTDSTHEREHVSIHLRESKKFLTDSFQNNENLSSWRWTVDEALDLDVIRNVFSYFSPNLYFTWHEVAELQRRNANIFLLNKEIKRNEGEFMDKGNKLWRRAQALIPGGNMLLSKRPEMFLPEKWPSYFSKAKGCTVWDLDGKKYTDMSLMGVGTNILGYGHSEVDSAVQKTIQDGNMSTLNCPEEVYLAEKLIDMHPWADMARFARSGGEANAIAIRIARAASGKDNVAVCGYHGWHDWYLSANLGNNENLSDHLLPGLAANGVPDKLKGTVFPFQYNDFSSLEELINKHDIGVIKMEVVRNMEPEDNFLHRVRELATQKGIVLIFDECTSGFRETFGGLHKKYGVEPDMAMFGKALGNGYAVTATIGRREIMEAAQTSFISSTFWTERIGSTAALKTLEIMERDQSWELITQTGKNIRANLVKIFDKYDLHAQMVGLPALTNFSFNSKDALKYKTFITQEMLKKGYLAGTSVYVCIDHSDSVIKDYMDSLDPIIGLIKECEDGRSIDELLEGPVSHSTFKRLN